MGRNIESCGTPRGQTVVIGSQVAYLGNGNIEAGTVLDIINIKITQRSLKISCVKQITVVSDGFAEADADVKVLLHNGDVVPVEELIVTDGKAKHQ